MPARLRDIRRAAKDYGVEIAEPSKGSHWKCTRPGTRNYPIPAHNGLKTEIDDKYISAMCKHFGVDEVDFRSKL